MIHIHLQRRDKSGYKDEIKRHNDTIFGGGSVSGSLHVELSISPNFEMTRVHAHLKGWTIRTKQITGLKTDHPHVHRQHVFNGIINPKAWCACASLEDVSVAPGEIRREETMSPVACFHFALINPNQFLGGGFELSFIFTPIWGNDPFWLIFFKWVETTNQILWIIQVFRGYTIHGGFKPFKFGLAKYQQREMI